MSKRKVRGVEVEMGSGNVYADLGYDDAEEMLIKAKLVTEIAEIIKRKGFTQSQAAALQIVIVVKAAPRSRGNGRLSIVFA